jgi:hypothetical protein
MKKTIINLLIGAAVLAGAAFALPNTYYVSISGNDTNFGTAASPFRTISHCVAVAGIGDTCNVLSGDYTAQGRINVNKAITLGCVNTKACIIRGAVLASGANMDGFYSLDNPLNDGGIVGANNNDITNNFVSGSCMVGIKVSGSNSLVAGNEVTRSRQCAGSSGPDADGIRFFGSGHIIESNYIHDIPFTNAPTGHIDCFQTWGGASNVTMRYNICDNYFAVIGVNNGTSGANIENCNGCNFYNNYFHVYGKAVLWEDSSSNGHADNNILVSGPVIAGTLSGQYGLFGSSISNGNVFYLYKASNMLVAGSGGTGNISADPRMSGYCSLAYPLKGIPCGDVTSTITPTRSITPTFTLTPSVTPSRTMTASPTMTHTITPSQTPSYTPTPTRTATPQCFPVLPNGRICYFP